MNISTLVEILNEMQSEHGDLEVLSVDMESGGVPITLATVDSVNIMEIDGKRICVLAEKHQLSSMKEDDK